MSAKTIYLGGEYENGVVVSQKFSNGSNVSANGNFSHAEGLNTIAQGDYSHTDGVSAYATDKYSYVWNGDETKTVTSHGVGTYTINTPNGEGGVYIGDKPLIQVIKDVNSSASSMVLTSNNTFTGTNSFNSTIRLKNTELRGNVLLTASTASVNLTAGSVYVPTMSVGTRDDHAASTEFVAKSMLNITNNNMTWNGVQTFDTIPRINASISSSTPSSFVINKKYADDIEESLKKYVDEQIGDIGDKLDAINGEKA